jgi:hypothetical protein
MRGRSSTEKRPATDADDDAAAGDGDGGESLDPSQAPRSTQTSAAATALDRMPDTLRRLSGFVESRRRLSLVLLSRTRIEGRCVAMASTGSGYGTKWKKWLAIYLAVGAVAYVVIYLLFFTGGGGGAGGGFHY